MKNKGAILHRSVCLALLLSVLLFVVFSFIPGVCADHDCEGERCFICLCVSACKNLSDVFLISACAFLVFAPEALSATRISESTDLFITEQTPVFLKVKLSR